MYDRSLRKREFNRILASEADLAAYRRIARCASFSKRILIVVFDTARRSGVGFVIAEWLFRFLYWPLVVDLWGVLKRQFDKK